MVQTLVQSLQQLICFCNSLFLCELFVIAKVKTLAGVFTYFASLDLFSRLCGHVQTVWHPPHFHLVTLAFKTALEESTNFSSWFWFECFNSFFVSCQFAHHNHPSSTHVSRAEPGNGLTLYLTCQKCWVTNTEKLMLKALQHFFTHLADLIVVDTTLALQSC